MIGEADHSARGGTCCSLVLIIPFAPANRRSLDCEDRPLRGRSSSLGMTESTNVYLFVHLRMPFGTSSIFASEIAAPGLSVTVPHTWRTLKLFPATHVVPCKGKHKSTNVIPNAANLLVAFTPSTPPSFSRNL